MNGPEVLKVAWRKCEQLLSSFVNRSIFYTTKQTPSHENDWKLQEKLVSGPLIGIILSNQQAIVLACLLHL